MPYQRGGRQGVRYRPLRLACRMPEVARLLSPATDVWHNVWIRAYHVWIRAQTFCATKHHRGRGGTRNASVALGLEMLWCASQAAQA
eukprot:3115182-Rhodomonas_salina.2